MKSKVLAIYSEWLKTATPYMIEFVDSVYAMCEKHYSDGGDTIVECFTPEEILKEFADLAEVRGYCGMQVDKALDARWGEDSDPELKTAKGFDKWAKEKLQ